MVMTAMVSIGGTQALAKGLYLESRSAVSDRAAVLEDDGHVAYLYLCAPGTWTPEREVVVYSRKAPVPRIDWWELSMTGDTAPISQDIASRTAVVPRPEAQQFSFRWSRDGQAVAVLRHGKAMAFLTAARAAGHSRAVSRPSPLGLPWDQRLYDTTFGR
jgi:hypothetical protein